MDKLKALPAYTALVDKILKLVDDEKVDMNVLAGELHDIGLSVHEVFNKKPISAVKFKALKKLFNTGRILNRKAIETEIRETLTDLDSDSMVQMIRLMRKLKSKPFVFCFNLDSSLMENAEFKGREVVVKLSETRTLKVNTSDLLQSLKSRKSYPSQDVFVIIGYSAGANPMTHFITSAGWEARHGRLTKYEVRVSYKRFDYRPESIPSLLKMGKRVNIEFTKNQENSFYKRAVVFDDWRAEFLGQRNSLFDEQLKRREA